METEILNLCERCGQPYINFCVNCSKAQREEVVEALMEKYGMSVEALIRKLSEDVLSDDNSQALQFAIKMRSMLPATKTDITSGGQPLAVDKNTKDRLAKKLAKLVSEPESGSEE